MQGHGAEYALVAFIIVIIIVVLQSYTMQQQLTRIESRVVVFDMMDAAIYAQIHKNELAEGKSGDTLVRLFGELSRKADATFGRMLERQAEANRVRRRLEVLERHQSLLNLPIAMRKAIEQGNHEEVVREYKKVLGVRDTSSALKLSGSGHAKLVGMIVADVEKAVDAFRRHLLRSLVDSSKGAAHHKQCIAYVPTMRTSFVAVLIDIDTDSMDGSRVDGWMDGSLLILASQVPWRLSEATSNRGTCTCAAARPRSCTCSARLPDSSTSLR